MNQTCQFMATLTEEQKLQYSRDTYKELLKDELFSQNCVRTDSCGYTMTFGLKETSTDDRFLFLHLFKEIKNNLPPKDYREMGGILSFLRHVSFKFAVSEKAASGVIASPELSRWGTWKDFDDCWNLIPQAYKDWMQYIFSQIPTTLAYLKNLSSSPSAMAVVA